MGTETRIGIVAGLVIVVVASVYFFYGSESPQDQLQIASGSKVVAPPKIPVSADQKPSAAKPADRPSGNHPAQRPPGGARPAMTKAPASSAGGTPTSITPQQQPLFVAQSRGQLPEATKPTALRTTPSSDLVEATRENLGESPTAERPKPPGASPSTIGERLRQADGVGPSNPPAGSASPAGDSTATLREPPRPREGSTVARPPLNVEGPSLAERSMTRPTTSAPVRSADSTPARSMPKPAGDTAATLGRAGEPSAPQPASAQPPTPAVAAWPKKHTIAEGDTLSDIAERYYGDSARATDIMKANAAVKDPRRLRIGDVVLIPDLTAGQAAGLSTRPPTGEPTRAGGQGPAAATTAELPQTAPPTERTYRVKPGETFYSIARSVLGDAKRVDELFQLNQSIVRNNPRNLRPGMVIRLPQ